MDMSIPQELVSRYEPIRQLSAEGADRSEIWMVMDGSDRAQRVFKLSPRGRYPDERILQRLQARVYAPGAAVSGLAIPSAADLSLWCSRSRRIGVHDRQNTQLNRDPDAISSGLALAGEPAASDRSII